MKKIFSSFLILTVLFLLPSCLDEIEIDKPIRFDDGYAIQGKLIEGSPSYFEVKIERLFQSTSNAGLEVKDAVVSLMDSLGHEFELTSADNLGVYRAYLPQDEFPVHVDRSYRIKILLNDGSKIVSDWDLIHAVPKINTINWTIGETEAIINGNPPELRPAINFFINSPLVPRESSAKAFLRWEFIDAYKIMDDLRYTCYVENRYHQDRLFLLAGNEINGTDLINYPLFTDRIGVRHIDGYYLSAFQQAISEEALNYWTEVKKLAERKGSIFDQPAGTIRTNLRCESDSTKFLYGYFYTATQDTFRQFVSREDMGELTFYCPRPPSNQPNGLPTICDSCLIWQGASYEKPFYWN